MNSQVSKGTAFGFAAYLLWGIFPLFFKLLDDSGAMEILLHRVVWSLLICLVLLAATHAFGELRGVLRSPRQLALLSAAAVAIAVNWGLYIYAVNSDQVIEASLGYFINPLVTVTLGVLVLHEKLRVVQWTAVAVGALAVVVLTVAYGHPPLIAMTLAVSFGTYGLIKKQVGGSVGALSGLTTETLVLTPIALIGILVIELRGDGTFAAHAPWQAVLLISAGFVTVAPLLLFAAAARRVPLVTLGLLQYLTPVLQLLCGVVILGEHMAPSRWFGFSLVWLALVLLSADSLATARRTRRASRSPELVPAS